MAEKTPRERYQRFGMTIVDSERNLVIRTLTEAAAQGMMQALTMGNLDPDELRWSER